MREEMAALLGSRSRKFAAHGVRPRAAGPHPRDEPARGAARRRREARGSDRGNWEDVAFSAVPRAECGGAWPPPLRLAAACCMRTSSCRCCRKRESQAIPSRPLDALARHRCGAHHPIGQARGRRTSAPGGKIQWPEPQEGTVSRPEYRGGPDHVDPVPGPSATARGACRLAEATIASRGARPKLGRTISCCSVSRPHRDWAEPDRAFAPAPRPRRDRWAWIRAAPSQRAESASSAG